MLRPLLVAVALLGAGVVFGAPGDPGYVDPDCAVQHYGVWVGYIEGEGNTGDGDGDGDPFTYECITSNGAFVATIEHVNAAVSLMGAPWSDRSLGMNELPGVPPAFSTEVSNSSVWRWPLPHSPVVTAYVLGGSGQVLGGVCRYLGRAVDGGSYVVEVPDVGAFGCDVDEWEGAKRVYEAYLGTSGMLRLASALVVNPPFVSEAAFVGKLEEAFYGGLRDEENYPEGWDGESGEGEPGGDWGEVPVDSEAGCRILDLFCWARWAFVPRTEWGAEFGALQASLMTRVPFGWATWFTPGHASFVPSDEGFVISLSDFCFTNMGPGPDGRGYCGTDVDLGAQVGMVWWHDNGRPFLFGSFVVLFFWAAFRRMLG